MTGSGETRTHLPGLKRAGIAYEKRAVTYAQGKGLPWDRERLRGTRDTLDTQGSAAGGFLVGFKAIQRGVDMRSRLAEAMDQAAAAKVNYHAAATPGHRADVVAVQVLQRSAAAGRLPIGQHYAVMTYDDLLSLAVRLAELEHTVAGLEGLLDEYRAQLPGREQ